MAPTKSSSFDFKIVKWIFVPLLIILLAVSFIKRNSRKNKCESECDFIGYSESKYYPPLREIEEKCLCIDPNDIERKNNIKIELK